MIAYIILDKPKSVRYNVHIGDGTMLNTNITNFRKNIFSLLEQTIKYNEPVNISTKEGNAVIISEEEYNGLMETVYLSSIPEHHSSSPRINGRKKLILCFTISW